MKKSRRILLSLLAAMIMLFSTCMAAGDTKWVCPECSTENSGNFCMECGNRNPNWICPDCGTRNTGKFCTECGLKRPETGSTTIAPTAEPTAEPTPAPTSVPTPEPTTEPTLAPTAEPTAEPTLAPGVRKPVEMPAVGDSYIFGSYEQDNDASNGTEPIEWIVLAVEEERVMLISRYALDSRAYHEKYTITTWEDCTLRTWLNDDFVLAAFTPAEQAALVTVTVSAEANSKYNTPAGNDTQDRVYLLSISEAKSFFKYDEKRMCALTPYAEAQGAYTSRSKVSGWPTGMWWLRTPGIGGSYAAGIQGDGSVHQNGRNVDCENYAVRPVLWMDPGLLP